MAGRWIRTLGYAVLVALATAWSIVPILWVLLGSFKPPTLIFELPPAVIFRPTLSNYVAVFTEWPRFISAYRNSITITSAATLLTVGVTVIAAYALSRYRFSGRNAVASLLILVRMLPPIVLIIPLFPLADAFLLLDTFAFLIVLYATFAVSFATWILKSFLDNLPQSQEEAALIDGCTRISAFIRIVLPQMKPAVAAVAVYVSIGFWNEFLFGFVFSRERAVPAPVIIAEMLSAVEGLQWGDLFAATTMLFVPMLILVWLIQSQLISGFTIEGGER